MEKYFVVFRIPLESMDQWAKTVPEEERKKQSDEMMAGWEAWRQKYKSAILDGGWPLGKTKRISAEGIADVRNDLNYGMLIEAPSHDEAAAIIAENPHLKIPTSFVDVMEIPHMRM